MSNTHPFGFVPIDPRRTREKPRASGLSMVIDDGLPIAYMKDALELAAPYIDLIKIKTGTVRLYPRDKFVQKLALYESFDILPFLGGQFHEYVFAKMGDATLPRFYDEARAVGFRAVEISDNTVPLTDAQRDRYVAVVNELRRVPCRRCGPPVVEFYRALLAAELARKDTYRLSSIVALASALLSPALVDQGLEKLFFQAVAIKDRRVRANAVELHSLGEFTSLDDLDHLGQLAHQASLLQCQHVNFGQTEVVECCQCDFSVELQEVRLEATLGQTTLQRHLTAFETHLVVAAGA